VNLPHAKGAAFNHGEHEREGCLAGTCETVLSQIELWMKDVSKPPIFWLRRPAGTEKTTIAQTITKRMSQDGHLGVLFFCLSDYQDQSNLQLIFPSLTLQLAYTYPRFWSEFIEAVKSNPEISCQSLHNQMDKLIAQPFKVSGVSTVIVVDALDKCDNSGPESTIFSVLGQLVSSIPGVKFFLTGRPTQPIQSGFQLPLVTKLTDTFALHEVEQESISGDIW